MGKTSEDLFREAQRVIPGGVNSPVRAFKSVGGIPLFIDSAAGSKIRDVEGREYIDYVASWGPMILGHAYPAVTEAILEAARKGTSYGAPTEAEVVMAEAIAEAIPSIEMLRMVNSGTEAVMSALRLARAATGRERIIKFEGCYHGHADSLLAKAGSGIATLGIPGSPGVPGSLASLTTTLPYNDIGAVRSAVERYGEEVACIIVEPVGGNMGVVLPVAGFLEGLREIASRRGIILIFDEVITGFRLRYGGFQSQIGIEPDLTTLGKIIGGGLPVGAFGGKRTLMQELAPSGPVYQAGTLSGNPLAMAAGKATLKALRTEGIYEVLEQKSADLHRGLENSFREANVPVWINRIGSMFTVFFTPDEVFDFISASSSDTDRYASYFKNMLAEGINMAPSQFETEFVSVAHTDEDVEKTVEACRKAIKKLARF